MKNYKVAAYITLYKEFDSFYKCIEGIYAQTYPVKRIFVIDNSPLSRINSYDDVVLVKHFPTNIGIGKGLEIALEWAENKGYDFLWTFDQDSIPEHNCLEILLDVYQKFSSNNYQIGIIAPTPIDSRNNTRIQGAVFQADRFRGYESDNQTNTYDCDAPITSGSLISIAAAKTISPPRSDLFIDGIDLDYGLRLKKKGFHNLIVSNTFMKHSFGNPLKIEFMKGEIFIQKYSAIRHYYICRNHTYLETRYAQRVYKITSFLRRIKYLFYTIIKILLFDSEDKILKTWGCLIGTFHGLIGKLGKTWK